jgi:photosystem II stability/assembly factor-like uncharacterized protein
MSFTKLRTLNFTLIFLLFAQVLFSQTSNTDLYQPLPLSERLEYSDDLPEFVKMTFQPNISLTAVETAFEAYEKAEKAKKIAKERQNTDGSKGDEIEDKYEVYYQRWKHAYEPFAQEDGTIVLPTIASFKRNIRADNQRFADQSAARNANANWTLVGPKETYWAKWDESSQAPCPWQVNIYAFDIAKSDKNVLYATPETGGVFKTIDKGLNWTACAPNFIFGGTGTTLEIHPTDPNTVYLGISTFLYKTTDGGNTWADLSNCPSIDPNDIAISPLDPNIVLVAADNGLFRSTNGGSTWTTIYSTACYDIELNPNDATHVFILKSNGANVEFLKSTNSGASFSSKNIGTTALRAGRLTVTPADGNRIYLLCTASPNPPRLMKSLDEGESWADMNATFCSGGVSDVTGGQGYYDLSIAASPTNANELIYGLCTTSKAVSVDGGNTFAFSYIGGYCGAFGVHPDLQEARSVLNGSQVETWISTDGGLILSTDFFSNNAAARNNGIYHVHFWGFGQGWNEDIMVGGRYHNGNTALADFYPAGKAIRMGGAEAGTGYVFHGQSRTVAFSDSEDKVLPSSFTGDDYGNFNYTKFPNEDGYGFNSSPFLIHPYYYKHQYFGEGTIFWKTTDNGATFVAINNFGSTVRRYDMSRSNPLVMYLATDAAFYKTINGGTSWTVVALPSGRSAGNLYIAINPTNENDVWIAFKNVSATTGKVYQSTNGGTSWVDKTTAVLSSYKMKNIAHTGGGIYVSADEGKGFIFYRSTSATDWIDFSTNLPPSMEILGMKPFYRDGKLRMAGSRGIWETPLSAPVAPLAMPTVDKNVSFCSRDTFYFDDYSIFQQSGASWSWAFSPTPQYVSSLTARNPKVVFGADGNYTVTLTISGTTGTDSKTLTNMVNVASNGDCEVSNVRGTALSSNADGDYMLTPAFDLGNSTDQITVMAWIRPSAGTQSSYAGILSCNGVNVNLNYRENNELGLHWNDAGGSYGWSSGLIVPANEWSHVALVVNGSNMKLYLNGQEKTLSTYNPPALNLSNRQWFIGNDRGNTIRTFRGLVDEVCFYNRILTHNEIREQMHLVKNPTTDATLKGYFQFNEIGSAIYNKAVLSTSNLSGSATKVTSTAPVATGTSSRLAATTAGAILNFTNQHMTIQLPNSGTLPNADLVVTELNGTPDQLPTATTSLNGKYWIVNNMGLNGSTLANQTFSPLARISFSNLGSFATTNASNHKLYKRKSGNDGATWGLPLDTGDEFSSADNNSVTFSTNNGVNSFSQFTLTNEALLPVELIDFRAALKGGKVELTWQVADEKDVNHYQIERSLDSKIFELVKKQETAHQTAYLVLDDTPPSGTIYYRLKIVEHDGKMTYSPIRSVNSGLENKTAFNIYPNPTRNVLNITFTSKASEMIDFELVNMAGQIVHKYRLDSRLGENQLYFRTDIFPAGVYALRIRQGNVVTVEKIVMD